MNDPHAPRVSRRLGLFAVASVGLHAGVLAMVSSTVVFPALRRPPALVAATLRPPEYLPVARSQDELEGALETSLTEIDHVRIAALPPVAIPTRVAHPQTDAASWDAGILAALAGGNALPGTAAQAYLALDQPATGRRGAFEGRMYFFSKLRRVRTADEWLTGSGRIEAEDRLYAYVCSFPGRASAKRPVASQRVAAVDYRATVAWPVSLAGEYEFRLTCDDGAIFQIDGRDVIDYDGAHPFKPREGAATVAAGPRELRLVYMQSHRAQLGLLLHYKRAEEPGWRLFDLREILLETAQRAPDPVEAAAADTLETLP